MTNLISTKPLSRISFHVRGLRKPNVDSPTDLIFFVTNMCNLRCEHCFLGNSLDKGRKDDLSLDEIQQVVKSLKRSLHSLIITGGEPILRKDILDICESFDKDLGVDQITLTTNGYYTDKVVWFVKNFLKNMKAKLLVQISLDGTADTHNKIRRNTQSFKRALKTAKELQKITSDRSVFEPSFLMTLHSGNYMDIGDLHKMTADLQVPLTFELMRDVSLFKTNGNYWATAEVADTHSENLRPLYMRQLKEITPMIENVYRKDTQFITGRVWIKDGLGYAYRMAKWDYLLNLINNKPLFRCSAGSKTGVIFADGKVSLCELTKAVGSLRENDYDFSKIWRSEEANIMRDKIRRCFCTHGCFIYDNMNLKLRTGVGIISNLIKYYYKTGGKSLLLRSQLM